MDDETMVGTPAPRNGGFVMPGTVTLPIEERLKDETALPANEDTADYLDELAHLVFITPAGTNVFQEIRVHKGLAATMRAHAALIREHRDLRSSYSTRGELIVKMQAEIDRLKFDHEALAKAVQALTSKSKGN